MLVMNWLDSHVGTIDDGIKLINLFAWFITVIEDTNEKKWIVKSGNHVILETDSRECVDTFIYGMALAYEGIPQEIFDSIVNKLKT